MAKAGDYSTSLTVERLREVLNYDQRTGAFTWRVCLNSQAPAGSVAGTVRRDGYRRIRIDSHFYYGHRLAWLYVYGEWPPGDLDHKDNVPGHDWIDNLRPATESQNLGNQRRRRDNTSGFKGASYWQIGRTWRADIRIRGRTLCIGYFATRELAHAAYVAKAKELFGEFANPG